MTAEDFIRNCRGLDDGRDLPRELLQGFFNRIARREIRMDEDDMYEPEVRGGGASSRRQLHPCQLLTPFRSAQVVTFVAPLKAGTLKKLSSSVVSVQRWQTRWFVLTEGCLYYFLSRQDSDPRCIVPLEGIAVTPGAHPTEVILKVGSGAAPVGGKVRVRCRRRCRRPFTPLLPTPHQKQMKMRGHTPVVKSMKRTTGSLLRVGEHTQFVLRAQSQRERDLWLQAFIVATVGIDAGITGHQVTLDAKEIQRSNEQNDITDGRARSASFKGGSPGGPPVALDGAGGGSPGGGDGVARGGSQARTPGQFVLRHAESLRAKAVARSDGGGAGGGSKVDPGQPLYGDGAPLYEGSNGASVRRLDRLLRELSAHEQKV